jgi:hypothetical protein
MKMLLFNGCSFMAGDCFAWEQFHKENNRPFKDWLEESSPAEFEFRKEYLEYRKNINLTGLIGKQLGLNKVDISEDGKSNEHIALETIAYIQSIPPEQRQQYHVVVGWTAISRVMKYSTVSNTFIDLTIGHYQINDPDPTKANLDDYIKARIIDADIHDSVMDYVRSIMLLENFLKCNNITYTFFRSVDNPIDVDLRIGPFSYLQSYTIDQHNVTDHSKWYKFNPEFSNNYFPFAGHSWASIINFNPELIISNTNPHPNQKTIEQFANELANFIPSTF